MSIKGAKYNKPCCKFIVYSIIQPTNQPTNNNNKKEAK